MKQYNKIGLSTTDGFTSAFVDPYWSFYHQRWSRRRVQ